MDAILLKIFTGRDVFMVIQGEKGYTVDDILALPEGERAELIDGEMFMMASPTRTHQRILGWMHVTIYNYIKSKKGKCQVYLAPFAVFLKNDNKNYVEPDVLVSCKDERVDEQGCHGAPDWAIEIVSPSSVTMDYKRKAKAYREAGVREYWIIDSQKEKTTVYLFGDDGTEEKTEYTFTDVIRSAVVEGLDVDMSEMYEAVR